MAPTWGPVAFLQGSLESDFYYMHTCVGNEESNQEDLCRWSSNNNAGRNNPKLLCPVWRGRREGGRVRERKEWGRERREGWEDGGKERERREEDIGEIGRE